jgi:hypothetical protein
MLVGVLVATANFPLPADTVTLAPVADTELDELFPTQNYGTSGDIVAGALSRFPDRRRILVKFDLSQIPAGSTISAVTFDISAVNKLPSGGGANSTFDIRRMLTAWNENEATWNQRTASAPWAAAGGAFGTEVSFSVSSSIFISGLGRYSFVSNPTMVSDVQGWVNTPSSNQGWLLLSESESTPGSARHFAAHEDAANAPSLTVDFTPATPPPPPLVITNNSPLPNGIYAMAYSQTLVATGGTPGYTWSVASGSLPAGLNLAGDGTLGGAPTAAGPFNFTARAVDNASVTNTKSFSLTIDPLAQPAISNLFRSGTQLIFSFNATAGQSYGVEFRDAFTTSNLWTTATNLATQSSSGNVFVTNAISGTKRFYRVRTP